MPFVIHEECIKITVSFYIRTLNRLSRFVASSSTSGNMSTEGIPPAIEGGGLVLLSVVINDAVVWGIRQGRLKYNGGLSHHAWLQFPSATK